MHFWLLMTSVLRIWLLRIFARPKKRMSQGLGAKIQQSAVSLTGCIQMVVLEKSG